MNNKFFRFEVKYPVKSYLAGYVEQDLVSAGAHPDKKAGAGGAYWVGSLYFDTFAFSDYYDKIGGLIKRKKIRARIYAKVLGEQVKEVYLEAKEKYGMNVSKVRVCLGVEEWNHLSKKVWSPLNGLGFANDEEKSILNKILYDINFKGRRPCTFIAYQRKPYLYMRSGNTLRVTFDSNIQSCQSSLIPQNANRFSLAYPSTLTVMEVKYTRDLPPFMKHIVRKYDLKREAISKYALGVEESHKINSLKK